MKHTCYFCSPVQDMNATIPCCALFNVLGLCPCSDPNFLCPFYIDDDCIRDIAVKKVLQSFFPDLKI